MREGGMTWFRRVIVLLAAISAYVWIVAVSYADTIVLKSGKEIVGPIVEETPLYIKVERAGNGLYFERKYIARIDRTSGMPSERSVVRNQLFTAGLDALTSGQFEQGEVLLQQAFAQAREDVDNISGALMIVRQMRNSQINASAAMNLAAGMQSLLQGKAREAELAFARALEDQPDDPDILYNLSVAQYAQGAFERSAQSIRRVLAARADDAEACAMLGEALYMQGAYSDARQSCLLARQLFRKNGNQVRAEDIDSLLERIPVTALTPS
jgi:tetratricopeptide (TPR) repeat protein